MFFCSFSANFLPFFHSTKILPTIIPHNPPCYFIQNLLWFWTDVCTCRYSFYWHFWEIFIRYNNFWVFIKGEKGVLGVLFYGLFPIFFLETGKGEEKKQKRSRENGIKEWILWSKFLSANFLLWIFKNKNLRRKRSGKFAEEKGNHFSAVIISEKYFPHTSLGKIKFLLYQIPDPEHSISAIAKSPILIQHI